jgi:hypothetical protein
MKPLADVSQGLPRFPMQAKQQRTRLLLAARGYYRSGRDPWVAFGHELRRRNGR